MIKRFFFILSFLVLSIEVFANEFDVFSIIPPDSTTSVVDRTACVLMVDEGRQKLANGRTKDALILFRQASVKDPNSWRPLYWISVCHYTFYNYGFALKYAKDALEKNPAEVDKEVYDLLGNAYHRLGEIDSALANYKMAVKLMSPKRVSDLEIASKIASCEFAKEQYQLGKSSKLVRLAGDVNSGYNDYGALMTNDGKTMYFTSRRSDTKGGLSNPDDQEFFEDIYIAQYNASTNTWDSVSNDLGRLNTAGFDAMSYISVDGLYCVLTVNNTYGGRGKSTKGSDLFEVAFSSKGKWNTPKRIDNKFLNSSYFEGSATLTGDGQTMYFVSDRNAEKNGEDIYVVTKNGKSWGTPKPVSDSINTTGKETTPFITPDGRYLFFSSDGHLGMGGLDIFVSENLGDSWTKPVNLGCEINTVNDDTHFRYYAELYKAYMTSLEIIGQKSSRDIYEIDMKNFVFPEFGK
jgi:tetratricopeptide (TPR) repeat protein